MPSISTSPVPRLTHPVYFPEWYRYVHGAGLLTIINVGARTAFFFTVPALVSVYLILRR